MQKREKLKKVHPLAKTVCPVSDTGFNNLYGSKGVNPLSKNSFAIFSLALALCPKEGLMVSGTVWAVIFAVLSVADSM